MSFGKWAKDAQGDTEALMKAGVGISCEEDARQAGARAAMAAVDKSGPAVVGIVVGAGHYDGDEVMAGVRSVLGSARLVGASCAGFFSSQGVFSRGIAVLSLSGVELVGETACVGADHPDVQETGRILGRELLQSGKGQGAILCFPDSFEGQVSQLVDSLYDTLGPEFLYFGGGAGDGWKILDSWQGTEKRIVSQGVAAALLGGCRFVGGVAHGWVPEGAPLVVTRAKGRVIFELDGRSAFDVYAERLGGFAAESFAETAMRHPLGICYGPERFIIRDPLQVINGTAIQFISAIPNQTVAYIMKPREDYDLAMGRQLSERVLDQLQKADFALISYCISRSLLMGEACKKELSALVDPLGSIPYLGFMAYGEIGSYGDAPQFHNKSISLLIGGA